VSFSRPRSIVRLVLLGFTAVALPLMAAVITAVVQVDRLARSGQMAVLSAAAATQESRAILENLTAMERSLGQYYVLGDRDFHRTYLGRRSAFEAAAHRLAQLDAAKTPHHRLTALLQAEAGVNSRLLIGGRPAFADAGMVSPSFAGLHEQARDILAESSQRIAVEADRTREAAAGLQRTLLLQAAAAVPVALLLAGLFVVLITRPLRQLDSQIRRLGSGSFDAAVAVKGPRDLEELGRRLDWLRRRVLELEEQKTAFLRHISHELKTPLTSIREGAELLLDDRTRGLNAEQKDIAAIMRDSSQQLQRLIEDLLEFGKHQTPRMEALRREPVALHEVIRRTVDLHSLGRTAKNLRIDLRLQPLQVAGDEKQLRIIVDNLLSNAIKYTPAGGEIQVSLVQEGEGAVLEVTDSGPGVAPEDRERVFEPFYQGKAPYAGPVQGTGLGLTIAKQYAQAHDGSIEILDSAHGRGARVRIRLPRAGRLRDTAAG
jgi:two-component system sensor histidine kinase GlrK